MITNQLLNPKSIAVIGGSNDITKPGGRLVKNLLYGMNENVGAYCIRPFCFCLNCDFRVIFLICMIFLYCHSELVLESLDINEETLKRVQGDKSLKNYFQVERV